MVEVGIEERVLGGEVKFVREVCEQGSNLSFGDGGAF